MTKTSFFFIKFFFFNAARACIFLSIPIVTQLNSLFFAVKKVLASKKKLMGGFHELKLIKIT